MNKPSVLVLQKNSLLNQALDSIVVSSGSSLVVVASSAKNIQELLEDISGYKPDVVLLEESMPMAVKDTLADLLTIYPNLRVIIVSKDSNWVHIYNKQDMLLTRLEDLLTVIHAS